MQHAQKVHKRDCAECRTGDEARRTTHELLTCRASFNGRAGRWKWLFVGIVMSNQWRFRQTVPLIRFATHDIIFLIIFIPNFEAIIAASTRLIRVAAIFSQVRVAHMTHFVSVATRWYH